MREVRLPGPMQMDNLPGKDASQLHRPDGARRVPADHRVRPPLPTAAGLAVAELPPSPPLSSAVELPGASAPSAIAAAAAVAAPAAERL